MGPAPYWQGEKSTRLPIGQKDCSSRAAHGSASPPSLRRVNSPLACESRAPNARRALPGNRCCPAAVSTVGLSRSQARSEPQAGDEVRRGARVAGVNRPPANLNAFITSLQKSMRKTSKIPADRPRTALKSTGAEGRKGFGTMKVAFSLCCVQNLMKVGALSPRP